MYKQKKMPDLKNNEEKKHPLFFMDNYIQVINWFYKWKHWKIRDIIYWVEGFEYRVITSNYDSIIVKEENIKLV